MARPILDRRALLAGFVAGGCLPPSADAQGLPPTLDALMRAGRYLPIFLEALRGGRGGGLPASQVAAFVGDEKHALAKAAEPAAEFSTLADVTFEPAIETIRQMAMGRRIVVLNESHSASRHRSFLAAVARGLRADGFTHLAAETFSNDAPSAALVEALVAGAQIDARHGTYLLDPVFAEAIREALALGYRMVPYEQRRDQRPTGGGISEREQAQAENLLGHVRRNADARFLVYVGFSHLREAPDEQGNRWFAQRLAVLLGEDPLTVTQASTGSFAPAADSPLARQLFTSARARRSFIARRGGQAISADRWAADLAVFHPPVPYKFGRPGWLSADQMRRRVRVRVPGRLSEPYLVQAIHATDSQPAIPADQILGTSGQREHHLFLRTGAYRLQVETLRGHIDIGRLTVV